MCFSSACTSLPIDVLVCRHERSLDSQWKFEDTFTCARYVGRGLTQVLDAENPGGSTIPSKYLPETEFFFSRGIQALDKSVRDLRHV